VGNLLSLSHLASRKAWKNKMKTPTYQERNPSVYSTVAEDPRDINLLQTMNYQINQNPLLHLFLKQQLLKWRTYLM
jgi:hypothetical protein